MLPASFESAFHLPVRADVWVPMAIGPDDNTTRNVRWLTFVARLGPGAILEQARARVATLSKAGYADRSSEMLRAGYTLVPLDDYVVGTVRPALLLLLGAVAVLLLIACGNVSGLVLARALGRRRDLAIRSSLGPAAGGSCASCSSRASSWLRRAEPWVCCWWRGAAAPCCASRPATSRASPRRPSTGASWCSRSPPRSRPPSSSAPFRRCGPRASISSGP